MRIVEKFLRLVRDGRLYKSLKKSAFFVIIRDAYYERIKRRSCLNVQKNGYELIEEIYEICNELSLTAWIDWGTLLGFCREGQMLFHDDDIDISLIKDYLERDAFIGEMKKNGYKHVREWSDGDEVIMDTFLKNGVMIDIDYVIVRTDDRFRTIIFEKEEQSKIEYKDGKEIIIGMGRYYFDTQKIDKIIVSSFKNGHMCPVPENYESRIQELYGKDWNKPVVKFDWHDLNNYQYDGFAQSLHGWMVQ